MKKTQRGTRKLALALETVRQLDRGELAVVPGASTGSGNSDCLSTRACNLCPAMD